MNILILLSIVLLGVMGVIFVVDTPVTIAAIYIREGDQIARKEIKASTKFPVDNDHIRKLKWNLEYIWEKTNDKPDRIMHYEEELQEKKMETYLKHNEELKQFYQELCGWGEKTKNIGKDQSQEELQKQLESYLFSLYEISDAISDELTSLEVCYLEKETRYQNEVRANRRG